jgi:hypothetical protein
VKVSCAHSHLHGAERVLGGLAPRAHSVRIFVVPLMHRLEYVLVLPARDAALRAWRAAAFERAIPAGIGPISVQLQPVFLARKTVWKSPAGRRYTFSSARYTKSSLPKRPSAFADEVIGLGNVTVMPTSAHVLISSPLK